jgi:hypothetical protein
MLLTFIAILIVLSGVPKILIKIIVTLLQV